MVDQLDYYQLLKAQPHADRRALERAFVTESKKYHPDRFHRSADPAVKHNATRVFRRISEAWSVLRDPKLRSAYDRMRATGQAVERITKADLEAVADGVRSEATAASPQARKYLEMAQQAERKGDKKTAIMQAQFALNAEPSNDSIKTWLEQLRAGS
jgi:DnaJ-class molecular chaperone